MTKTINDFRKDLGQVESSGRYDVVNPFGYIGKYQMGESAMIDAGYYKKSGTKNNKWDGEFTGKDGIYSKQDFLNSPQAQENAFNIYKKRQWQYLKDYHKYVGQTINGIKITPAGMLAGAHNGGHGGVITYIKSNGTIDPTDGNGVHVSRYLKQFADYNVSEITGLPNDNNDKEIKENEKNSKKEKVPQKDETLTISSSKNTDNNLSNNSDFRQIINDLSRPDRIVLNSILYAFEHTDKEFSHKYKIMYTLPKVLRTVAKINNLPLETVTELLIQSIKSHKRNMELQNDKVGSPTSGTVGSPNGRWVTINGNHVFIEDK